MRLSAYWRDHRMLSFLDHAGFTLAPSHILECVVHPGRLGGTADTDSRGLAQHSGELDYSVPAANDFDALERDQAEVRTLAASDFENVLRIDRRTSGRSREMFLRHAFEEALRDSAVRISLIGFLQGTVAGYLMARADFGDFGRTEPVAILDSIGVDPAFAHHHVGTALLSQLFVNLHALQVDRIETVVGHANTALLGFFARLGFAPSQRLAFVKELPPQAGAAAERPGRDPYGRPSALRAGGPAAGTAAEDGPLL